MAWVLSAFADEAGGKTSEQIEACKKGGLKFIDPRNVDGYNITQLPLDLAKDIAKQYEAAGIKVNMYGSPIGKIDATDDLKIDTDKLEHLAKLRDIFGCNAVRIFSYFNKKANLDKAQWTTQSLDRLKKLRDLAGKLDMVLYHENESHILGDTPEDVAKIATLRDGKTFKMIYDFANYVRTDTTPMQCWNICKPFTDCFHFKDQKKTGEHVPMGRGDTHATEIVKDAIASGWSGPCIIEPHLSHSKAVIATGVSGSANKALKDMTSAESFQVAVDGAKKFLDSLGVKFA